VTMRLSSPVLIGREAEQSLLRAVLQRVAAGETVLVTVGGDPGIGKTRLVNETAEEARRLGFHVLTGGCLDLGEGTLPFGAVVEALRQLTTELDHAELDHVLDGAGPELSALLPELSGGQEARVAAPPGRVLEVIRAVLSRLGEKRPVLVVLEDVHWADDGTRSLVRYLARNLRSRVGLILTYRVEELHQRYPLRLLLAELHRNSRCERLVLGPLTSTALAELLGKILDQPVSPELLSGIMSRSEGNPFYAEELVAAHARGAQLTEELRSLLMARVEGLPPDAQRLLRVVAAGGRVGHQLLTAITGQPEESLTELLRLTVAHHVLTPEADGESYAFRHALVREVVYADLLPGERHRLHARFAAALNEACDTSSAPPSAADLGRLAYHWHQSGDVPRALLASVQAGLAAEAASAPSSAERHYDRALELWDLAPQATAVSPLDRPALLRRAAENAHLAGDYNRGIALIGEALAGVDRDTDPLAACSLLELLGYCQLAGSDIEAAAAAYRAAVELAPTRPPSAERARALTGQSHVMHLLDHNQEAIATARVALATAEEVDARPTEARALNVLGASLCQLGQLSEGLACLEQAGVFAQEVGDTATLLWTRSNQAEGLLGAGQARRALEPGGDVLPLARSLGAAANYGVYGAAKGLAEPLLWLGEWSAARRVLDELLDLEPPPATRAHVLLASGLLHLWRGNLTDARAELTAAIEDSAGAMIPNLTSVGYTRLAHMEIAAGDLDRARNLIRTGLTACASSDGVATQVRLAVAGVLAEVERAHRAHASHRDDEADAARAIGADLVARARSAAGSPNARGLRIMSAEMCTAEAEWARINDPVDGQVQKWGNALHQWRVLEFPYPAAHAGRRLAEAMLMSEGRAGDASAELIAAWDTAKRLGAERLAEEIEALADRARIELERSDGTDTAGSAEPTAAGEGGLTPRERQVLGLLAEGMSNRRIAATLFISEKTVAIHVTHILAKLQVTNRNEAGAMARRLGSDAAGAATVRS
jgi:DNA-binding CsgD family transcriptional regulator/tetratricopeptide (TPR) repeat protein